MTASTRATGVVCPACRGRKSIVKDSRHSLSAIRRRRVCLDCGEKYTTMERVRPAGSELGPDGFWNNDFPDLYFSLEPENRILLARFTRFLANGAGCPESKCNATDEGGQSDGKEQSD